MNRKLKQSTTRPSHFRMVELSDFMAYLVTSALESYVFQHYQNKEYVKKQCARFNILYQFMKGKCIFSNVSDSRLLYNAFIDSPPQLMEY